MAKLTDSQLIVLSKAAARDDGTAIIPEGLNKAAAVKVAASLVSRQLMREVRSKANRPVWREDEEGRGTSLVITRKGREAIGLEHGESDSSNPSRLQRRRVYNAANVLLSIALSALMNRGPDRSRQ